MSTNLALKITKLVLRKIAFAKAGFLELAKFLLTLAFDKFLAFISLSLPKLLAFVLFVKSAVWLKVVFNIEIGGIAILLNLLMKYL